MVTLTKDNLFLTRKQAKTQTHSTVYLENLNNGESNDLKTALSEVQLSNLSTWVQGEQERASQEEKGERISVKEANKKHWKRGH